MNNNASLKILRFVVSMQLTKFFEITTIASVWTYATTLTCEWLLAGGHAEAVARDAVLVAELHEPAKFQKNEFKKQNRERNSMNFAQKTFL